MGANAFSSINSRIEWRRPGIWRGLKAAPLAIAAALFANEAQAGSWPAWETVVNNGMVAPTSTPQASTPNFFSYNQSSVNDNGLVVFRARSKPLSGGGGGGGGGVTQGIYTRDMSVAGSVVNWLADNKGVLVTRPEHHRCDLHRISVDSAYRRDVFDCRFPRAIAAGLHAAGRHEVGHFGRLHKIRAGR